jgi:hypothetical protein
MGILIQVKVRIRRGVENLARAPKDSLGAAGGPHYDPLGTPTKWGEGGSQLPPAGCPSPLVKLLHQRAAGSPIGDRHNRRAWQHVAALLLEAAERNGSVAEVRKQVILALMLDGRLDVRATVPAG